jgi:hypothetical protein
LFFAKRNEFPAYVDTTIPISPVARNFYAHGAPKLASFLPYWLAIFIDRFWLLAISIIAFIYPLTYLNVHLRKFRFIVRERTHYALLLEIESEIANKPLNADEKQRLLHKLDLINKHAISKTIPVGEESAYFLFVNAVQLLRNKLLRSQ